MYFFTYTTAELEFLLTERKNSGLKLHFASFLCEAWLLQDNKGLLENNLHINS